MRLGAIKCSEPPGMSLRKSIARKLVDRVLFRNYTPDHGPVSIVLGGQKIYVLLFCLQ